MNKNPPKLGPKGYRGHEAEWQKEREEAKDLDPTSLVARLFKVHNKRVFTYIRARCGVNSRKQLLIPEGFVPIVEELVMSIVFGYIFY